jgi:signal transduction histidine kinase
MHTFRVVQEALNNAARHSGTKVAEIEMVFSPDSLAVTIRDFGRGMPPTKKGTQPGLGLIAMRERAELLNAKIEISSVPNAGTTVTLVLPLQQEDQASEALKEGSLQEVLSP